MHNNENIQLDGYSLIRSDPRVSTRSGICLYYKESLAVKVINFSAQNECIHCEVFIEKCIVSFLLCIDPQAKTMTNLKIFIFIWGFNKWNYTFKPLVLSYSGRFYCPISHFVGWWQHINRRYTAWCTFFISWYTSTIKELAQLMKNSAWCIDLIFTDQPNLVIVPGFHPSLHTNCHHQIVYCKLNINIKFSPPYECLVGLITTKLTQKKLRNLLNKFTGKIYLITKIPIIK